jgi:hypothetical protein
MNTSASAGTERCGRLCLYDGQDLGTLFAESPAQLRESTRSVAPAISPCDDIESGEPEGWLVDPEHSTGGESPVQADITYPFRGLVSSGHPGQVDVTAGIIRKKRFSPSLGGYPEKN